ncbi:hypothetical protein ACJDUG_15235 [Clostridium sp. WILCCON 0185]|uniref:Uncharacterized protein n=2 Tax=Candidatus Clostridium stratigraminis TaxID=3381661 RepID=A0ABW8T7M5_9CLOT
MENVIEIKNLILYKKAVKLLQENDIEYDKAKLLKDPELCSDIVNIINHLKNN